MSLRFAPPESYIQTLSGAFAPSPTTPGWVMGLTPVDFCTFMGVHCIHYNEIGGTTQGTLDLVYRSSPPPLGSFLALTGLTVIASWSVTTGRMYHFNIRQDFFVPGSYVGLRLTTAAFAFGTATCALHYLPWVDRKRPQLRPTLRRRQSQTFTIPNIVAGATGDVIAQMPPQTRHYIITEIQWTGPTIHPRLQYMRPYLDILPGVDPLPTGNRRTMPLGVGDILAPTAELSSIETRGRLGSGILRNLVRPWYNVRISPSTPKFLCVSAAGTVWNINCTVEYLSPLPWWRNASLLRLARGS